MIREAIKKVIEDVDLSAGEMTQVMTEIMKGEALPAQIACFLTALRKKGETVDEISAAASVMRQFATRVSTRKETVLDTCGTGGDGSGTFNVSTVAAFVAAGAGIAVAKHGNRSVSSKCGSADLLAALGVGIEADAATVKECIEEAGIGFLFAPLFHPAMKHAMPVRKEIGIRTVFNILGPLTNPASATNQLLGVYDGALTGTLAAVLGKLGSKHALVVHSSDGLDEISPCSETAVSELKYGKVENYTVKPEDFGLEGIELDGIRGGGVSENVNIAKSVLAGKSGPARETVVLNAGFAIYAGDGARDAAGGMKLAREAIDSGAAMEKLELLREKTKKFVKA